MALTDRKRRFAAARRAGASNKDAAIAAGYSEKTASQAGSRLAKDPDVIALLSREALVIEVESQRGKPELPPAAPPETVVTESFNDPIEFLKAVMNNPAEDPKLRVDAAKAMLPFLHHRLGEGGKKEAAQEKAKKAASGKFKAAPPPKLKVVGGN